MNFTSEAKEVASILLEHRCVVVQNDRPFKWSSGLYAPLYCDNRILLSYPSARKKLTELFLKYIRKNFTTELSITGVATGAIGIGAIVAHELDVPFAYVRPSPKSHGKKNQIEGNLPQHIPTLVIEDLISTGKSSLATIDALKESGVDVAGLLAIFSYGFPETTQKMNALSGSYHTLCSYGTLLEVALGNGYISSETAPSLEEWSADPQKWSERHSQTLS